MITIERRNGNLRYNFSRQLSIELFNKVQFRPSAKLKDTPINWIKAEGVVSEMKLDYLVGRFDKTLAKYGLTRQDLIKQEELFSLKQLIENYLEFKVLANSTRSNLKRLFLNILEQSKTQDPYQLFNWVKANRSPLVIRRFVSFMKEAIEWAIPQERSPLGQRNPFIGMVKEAKNIPKSARKPKKGLILREGVDPEEFEDCRAFIVEEREVILLAFSQSSYHFLVNFITFLFLTGCRLGEACEIRWKDIFLDLESRTGRISFSRSYSESTHEVKSTKTDQKRKLPIRVARIFDLLFSIRPKDAKPDDLVFTWDNGKRINIGSLRRIWGASGYDGKPGIVLNLANEGKIRTYLKLYACRHTFISLQISAGPKNVVVPLANWVGNSPATIFKSYVDDPGDIFPLDI